MVYPISIPSPHRAVAHLSLWERLNLPHPRIFVDKTRLGKATSPLPWGEEQGEGVSSRLGRKGVVALFTKFIVRNNHASG